MSGFVYFILATESGRVKIGHTSGNPWERLDNLQTGNHERLQLFASIRGSARAERRLHERFRAMREQGEWFVPGPELVGFMDGVRAADPSCIHREHIDRIVAEWRASEVKWAEPGPVRERPKPPTEEERVLTEQQNRKNAALLLACLRIRPDQRVTPFGERADGILMKSLFQPTPLLYDEDVSVSQKMESLGIGVVGSDESGTSTFAANDSGRARVLAAAIPPEAAE